MNMFVELGWHTLILALIPLPFILGAGLEILWEHRKARRAAGVPRRPTYRQRWRERFSALQPAPQH